MSHRTAVIGATLVIAVGMACGTPATAGGGDTLPLTKRQMRQASMQLSDIPDSFSEDPHRTTKYAQGVDATRFDICVNDRAKKVLGKRPAEEMDATIMLKEAADSRGNFEERAVISDIYGYTSMKTARRAWKRLDRAADGCAAAVTEDTTVRGQPGTARITQRVSHLPRLDGAPGFSISQDIAIEAGSFTIYHDGYMLYRRVGPMITRIEFINLTSESAAEAELKPRWKRFTRQESATVSGRVAAFLTS
ncbi:MAG: hypothetical protein KDC39_03290 [Actinobacteria bacterium]|nr:hypothetical protein [Actinomycetota bacterium]